MHPEATADRTLNDVIEQVLQSYEVTIAQGAQDPPLLVPLSILSLMYLASKDPDVELAVRNGTPLPKSLRGTQMLDLGLRVGSAFRDYRKAHGDGEARPGTGGWHVPPHIRKAHPHRYRIATRDNETGEVVGDRSGIEGIDWHYETRWLWPIEVNCGDQGPQPVIRDIAVPLADP
jgi:hypothetical protein